MTIDQKIALFTEAYRVGVLDVADMLMNSSKSGTCGNPLFDHVPFAVLFLVFSYFEMISKMEDGYVERWASELHFAKGLGKVLPEVAAMQSSDREALARRLYRSVRCGYYHVGLLLDNSIVVSGRSSDTIETDDQKIRINPHLLVCKIKAHFAQAGEDLSNPANALQRSSFEQWFDSNFHL